MSEEELEIARLNGDTIRMDANAALRCLDDAYALAPQLFDGLLSNFEEDNLDFWEEILQWEETDGTEPTEYFFSNPYPYLKPTPLATDRPKHNFWFDET